MANGESDQINEYRFEMSDVQLVDIDNYQATRVTFKVFKRGELIKTLYPEKRYYFAGRQIMTEADIDDSLARDLYIALGEALDETGQVWSVRIYVKPYIRLIWLGAILMAFGGIIGMMDKRYRKLKVEQSSSTANSGSSAENNRDGALV